MGRPRTTGCTARHWPDEPCRACAAARARRTRKRRSDAKKAAAKVAQRASSTPTPQAKPQPKPKKGEREPRRWNRVLRPSELDAPSPTDTPAQARAKLDKLAAERRRALVSARAYVAIARRRGLIAPPDVCDRCGVGERLTKWSKSIALVPWHPDPYEKKQVAWLCVPCRKHVRATREPIVLTWVWPGGVPQRPRGRPVPAPAFAIDPDWRVAAEAAAVRATLPGLAAELFLHAFLDAVGSQVETLYAVGVGAGAAWEPLGDPARDAALRGWVERERRRRAAGELLVEPVPAWERRPRRDRLPPVPPPEAERPPFIEPEPWHEPVMPIFAVADAADREADAFNERVKRTFDEWRQRRKR